MRIFSLVILLFLAACQSTSTGIGSKGPAKPGAQTNLNSGSQTSSANTSQEQGIEVIEISVTDALKLAGDTIFEKFPQNTEIVARRATDIIVRHRNFWKGDVEASIEPILVKDRASGDLGVYFKIDARGVGSNFSMIPGYLSDDFFEELPNQIAKSGLKTRKFSSYEVLEDKGVAEFAPAYIPVDFENFVKYLENQPDLSSFEGVWEADQGDYTLGLYFDEDDVRYPHKAFVIESNKTNWKQGEIKVKFSKLDSSGLAISNYLMANKSEIKITFEASPSALINLSPPEPRIIFIKTWPRDTVDRRKRSGSGSGWHAGGGFIVTNAHVINKAKAINVRIGAEVVDARVVTVDEKLDIAVIKLSQIPSDLGTLPISQAARPGQTIFAVGFPLGDTLGKSPKITDGLISSDEGLGGDPTNLTISAPIQPGNSGGPLLDEFGNVVGVVVGDVENVNYAIKARYVMPLLEDLGLEMKSTNVPIKNVCDAYCSGVVYIETE